MNVTSIITMCLAIITGLSKLVTELSKLWDIDLEELRKKLKEDHKLDDDSVETALALIAKDEGG